MPTISQNRDKILQQLHGSEQAAAQLFTGLSRVQVNWQPSGGKSWSIWQCFDHLARTNNFYCQAMMEALANPRQSATGTTEITPGWFGRWFIAKMEPPAQARFKAMAKVVPAANGDAQDALRAFLDSHAEVRRVLESWERVDFNRVRFQNPFVPVLRFTVGTGLMVINAHDRRHLWQAGCVKEAGGFPAA
jgi:hypothetical protein